MRREKDPGRRLDPMNTLIFTLFGAALIVGFYLIYASQVDRFVSRFFDVLTLLLIAVPIGAVLAVMGWAFIFWEESRAKARAARAEAQEREKSAAAPIFQVLEPGQSALVFDPQSKLIHNTALEPRRIVNNETPPNPFDFSVMAQHWHHLQELARVQNIKILKPDQAELLGPGESAQGGPPSLIRAEDYIRPDQGTSIKDIILGASAGGQLIRGALRELSHIGIAGTTQWGKSTLMQAILYQVFLAREKTDVYLSDIGGTSFIDFAHLANGNYVDTIADTEEMARKLAAAMLQRKELYKATGQGIRSLDMYNHITGADLPWAVFCIDEATALMEQSKQLTQDLLLLVTQAAKYGILLTLAAQDWKSKHVPTTIRNQFSTRLQFRAEDSTQANILIKASGAEKIANKGRAICRLPGGDPIELQALYVAPETLQTVNRNGQAAAIDAPDQDSAIEKLIVDMFNGGASLTQCFKHWHKLTTGEAWPDGKDTGGPHREQIKEILRRHSVQID